MVEEIYSHFLINTKLHRPPLSKDHIHRNHLLEKLSRGVHQPFSLVSAPAGYGKSTLVSCWLEQCAIPSVWLSLDNNDNDLRLFLLYLVKAIHTVSMDACSETLAMLHGTHLPPSAVLHRRLINDIDEVKTRFILVLDDYHLIRNKRIHTFIGDLLTHPPASIHITLISRRDPPLPLTAWRAKGKMEEIRVEHLRFSIEETSEFLELVTGKSFDNSIISLLDNKTEGWVTGLRLAAISSAQHKDLSKVLTTLPEVSRYVVDYVIKEHLSHHPPVIQECILKISILNRFCAPLCESVCFQSVKTDECEIDSSVFMKLLDEAHLFVVQLDNDHNWFRYHHLIQSVLKRQLRQQFKKIEIENLYRRASLWFAQNGNLDEALSYSLKIEDFDTAANLVTEHRWQLMNKEQWFRLDLLLRQFPDDYIRQHPSLLLSKAWIYQRQARYSNLFEILKELEDNDFFKGVDATFARALLGEVETLRGFYFYSTAQAKRAETSTRNALEKLPTHFYSSRGMAQIILSLALQMQGEQEKSQQVIDKAMQEEETLNPVYKTHLLAGLCYNKWITADLNSLKPTAELLARVGRNNNLLESVDVGNFFTGVLHFEQNNLEQAELSLVQIVDYHHMGDLAVPSIVTYCQSAFALSLTYEALGRSLEATQMVDSVYSYMLESGNADLMEMCRAFQAELSFRQGVVSNAESWIRSYSPCPLIPTYRFYSPQITYVKVLLSNRDPDDIEEADALLSQMSDYYKAIHSNRMLIYTLVLQALALDLQSNEEQSFNKLIEADALAKSGQFIRPFLDCGREMMILMNRFAKRYPDREFTFTVLDGFASQCINSDNNNYETPKLKNLSSSHTLSQKQLSKRELEVLKALAKGWSNNEIANSLNISPETVKRHLSTIYRKLSVKNRHQAVIICKSYGIL